MAGTGEDASERPEPVAVHNFVFWDPCIGIGPIAVEEPWLFLMGQVIAAAVSLGLFGLLIVVSLS